MNKRQFIKCTSAVLMPFLNVFEVQAKTYLSIEQAQKVIYPDQVLVPQQVGLSKDQVKSIKKAAGVRVRNKSLHVWKTQGNDWFIVDQVIGKHENIDVAVAISYLGRVTGIEILTYRESYGHQVRHPKWLAQFFGKSYQHHFELDKNIQNISGATLSCSHITDAINRLLWTWQLVLNKT